MEYQSVQVASNNILRLRISPENKKYDVYSKLKLGF